MSSMCRSSISFLWMSTGADAVRLIHRVYWASPWKAACDRAEHMRRFQRLGARHRLCDPGTYDLPAPRRTRLFLLIFFRDFTLRSEEHTSELQSLMRISYAVFCLKTKNKQHNLTKSQITHIYE